MSIPSALTDDEHWMRIALDAARAAAQAGEVPVGAVVVQDGVAVATGANTPRAHHDPTAHAEILALRGAARALGNYRLEGCTLYVTLEPCLMCAGAMLHARLARVVFGAPDPKTGAAGSVANPFADVRLNHRTRVTGGVLAQPCAELLRAFFEERRTQRRSQAEPLREDALRTPQARFEPWPQPQARYVSGLPALAGLRLSHLDAGPAQARTGWLMVHGARGWSLQWQAWVEALAALGQRAVAPDLPGFGRSDKPKKSAVHRLQWHAQVLGELARHLGLVRVVLVLAEADAYWLAPLAQALGGRCVGALTVPLRALPPEAERAPYPDAGHRAGPRALERLARDADPGVPDGLKLVAASALGLPPGFTLDRAEDAGRLARRAVEYFAVDAI